MRSILASACRCAWRVSAVSVLFVPLAVKPTFFAGPGQARAESETALETVEVRDFKILVDGDHCGKCRISIEARPDGRHVVLGDSSAVVKYFLLTFKFSSQINETWNDGKLEKLENAASYGNNRYQVSATGDGDKVVVRTDGQERKLPSNVWTTSYWHAPEEQMLGQKISLLDSHKGRTLSAKLERVGEEPISLGDKDEKCSHYRLRGDVEVDLWYDAAGRLVRKEAMESGHRTRLQLVAIKS